ncbi:MAG: DNA-processing protein DprA [Anaplasmataceae bacterium]|nr:DNA-processing protein DprA [Anaplasmataceae bacterium]
MRNDIKKVFYNALTLALHSSYAELRRCDDSFNDWIEAWKAVRHNHPQIDPEKEFSLLQKHQVELILREDDHFPAALREIPLSPFGIYIQGKIPQKNQIAVVGTRKPTDLGKKMALDFSSHLAKQGLGIVSGLALGIDAAAHEGSLEAQGYTAAVLARGLDKVYPSLHSGLAKRIIKSGGALISEYPLGTTPLPYRFLERNRIVSGLTKGVLMIEVPQRSGAMATGRFALEQNREVWVTPGSIYEKNYGGSHNLIREGATLVTRPQDILESIGITPTSSKEVALNLSSQEIVIFDVLKKAAQPLSVDKISEVVNLDIRIVGQNMTYLLMKEIVTETPRGFTTTLSI